MIFSYKVVELADTGHLESELNFYGAAGWEIVKMCYFRDQSGFAMYKVIFKKAHV